MITLYDDFSPYARKLRIEKSARLLGRICYPPQSARAVRRSLLRHGEERQRVAALPTTPNGIA
jgi:hypothetical protein